MLWSCLLSGATCQACADSRLYRLPCHWGEADVAEPAGSDSARAGGLKEVLPMLDSLCLLRPEGAWPFRIGDTADDAVPYVALIGLDGSTEVRRAFFLPQDWVEQLWQSLLIAPGASFADPDSPLAKVVGQPAAKRGPKAGTPRRSRRRHR